MCIRDRRRGILDNPRISDTRQEPSCPSPPFIRAPSILSLIHIWVQAVTPEQVREVARNYLTDDRLTVATLEPLPLDDRRPNPPPAALDHVLR